MPMSSMVMVPTSLPSAYFISDLVPRSVPSGGVGILQANFRTVPSHSMAVRGTLVNMPLCSLRPPSSLPSVTLKARVR